VTGHSVETAVGTSEFYSRALQYIYAHVAFLAGLSVVHQFDCGAGPSILYFEISRI